MFVLKPPMHNKINILVLKPTTLMLQPLIKIFQCLFTNETELDYCHQKLNKRVTSQVFKQLRILGNEKIQKSQN